jgi:hypothetical protein
MKFTINYGINKKGLPVTGRKRRLVHVNHQGVEIEAPDENGLLDEVLQHVEKKHPGWALTGFVIVHPWFMPTWMEQYRELICNTGGNTIEQLMNGDASPLINLPLSTLQACVKSQVTLLETLHDDGALK